MKVLHVIPSIAPAHGGPSAALRMFEQAMQRAGVATTTLTTDDGGPRRREKRPLGVPVAEEGATRVYVAKRSEFYKAAPGLVPWLLRHVRDYDVVHVHALFSFTSTAAAWIARWRGVPYVLRPLGTLAPYGFARRAALKRLSFALNERPLLRHAAAVHFTSEAERRQSQAAGVACRGVVIPLAVPAAGAGQRKPAGAGTVLYLSRLDPKKNVEALLHAWQRVCAKDSGATLAIAGSGDTAHVSALKQLADDLGIAARVSWLGHVAGADKSEALASADLFVLPSLSENFGIAAAEALAAGLPCVLGEGVAIAAEVQEAGAGLAVAPTADAIAQALLQLLGDALLRSRMGTAARALARERYSIDAMAAALARLYRDVAPHAGGAAWA